MKDNNGIEIKTGDIVEITGAYFKNDNGFYFVDNSPGDPSWCGSDHCLKRISKRGKISTAQHNICFWPIGIFVSDHQKAAEGRRWNAANARIEVKTIDNISEVSAHFQAQADRMEKRICQEVWQFGENSEIVQREKVIQAHYMAVAKSVTK